jgi:A/G-specific adenine glycosylase
MHKNQAAARVGLFKPRAQNFSRRSGQDKLLFYIVRRLLEWFDKNARDLPWRRTRDPYAIWVSEIMLQQTQVKTVMPYWERWMRELPSIEALAKARPERVLKLWEGLGYYQRARNMQKAAQQIIAGHDGKFPDCWEDVLALPGVGRYTAGAICSIAFNQPRPILDGNVIRVLSRLFGLRKNPREKSTNEKLWSLAERLVTQAAETGRCHRPLSASRRTCSLLNQALMELGALVCTPHEPKCQTCPLRPVCVAHDQDIAEALPNAGRRPMQTRRRFVAFVVERRGRFWVRQRPRGEVNAHLWEFPNVELSKDDNNLKKAARCALRTKTVSFTPLCTIKHSITRFRIALEVFFVQAKIRPPKERKARWLTLKQMHSLAFPSAHRRILQTLEA